MPFPSHFPAKILYAFILIQYHASFIILYYDQQLHNYFTNYHTVIICEIIVHLLS